MNIEVLLDKLLKAVKFKFDTDPTAPGVVTAVLGNGKYYVSVVRFTQSFGKGKVVVCKAQAETLLAALTEAAQKFLVTAQQPVNPVQALDGLLSNNPFSALVSREDDTDLFSEPSEF